MKWIPVSFPPAEDMEVLFYIANLHGVAEDCIVQGNRHNQDGEYVYLIRNYKGGWSPFEKDVGAITYWTQLPKVP